MEAFLTLNDTDLKEIGISQQEPRRQILAAITELKSGKGREKQQYQESMRQFSSTLKNTADAAAPGQCVIQFDSSTADQSARVKIDPFANILFFGFCFNQSCLMFVLFDIVGAADNSNRWSLTTEVPLNSSQKSRSS